MSSDIKVRSRSAPPISTRGLDFLAKFVSIVLGEGSTIFESRINFSSSVITIQGGCSKNNTWMQMFSDVTNKTIRVLKSTQAGVRGAAIFGGVGVGIFNSVKEGIEIIRDDEIFYYPNSQYFQSYQELQGE
ncbi:FGGY-family carbohydrate kinase [Ammoniphilus sp. 3BR4]|uniref:FGGY-family carbohydrate kinase n=1 Tax=Ammoniphilus sp. 3BR4 TaxID=3158265 RepID=UPI003466DAF1